MFKKKRQPPPVPTTWDCQQIATGHVHPDMNESASEAGERGELWLLVWAGPQPGHRVTRGKGSGEGSGGECRKPCGVSREGEIGGAPSGGVGEQVAP